MSEKIILGIDPGTTIMGFGIIKIKDRKMSLIEMNELNLKKHKDHYLKLKLVFERTISLIEEFNPDEIAIEAPFFGKNIQSMLKLGRAQGIAMAAGLSREIPITSLYVTVFSNENSFFSLSHLIKCSSILVQSVVI